MYVTANLSSPSLYSLVKYGCIRRNPQALSSVFYLSFEDALWEILEQHPLKSKSILLPSFFCTDVSSRLVERGIEVSFYSFDSNLRFIVKEFTETTHSKTFGAIILYYPLGMKAFAPSPHWLREQLGPDALIIEDLADCLVEEKDISLIDTNHLAIDSIRKLLPLQGARVWTKKTLHHHPSTEATLYKAKTFFLWNVCRLLGGIYNIIGASWIDTLRWNIFSSHSDLIGTCRKSARGFLSDQILLNLIDTEAYKSARAKTIQLYTEAFASFRFPDPFGLVQIDSTDIPNVRFPVFCGPKNSLVKLSEILEKQGISTDTHFDDSPLGLQHDFLLLPSAFNMTRQTITMIAKTCFDFSISYTNQIL